MTGRQRVIIEGVIPQVDHGLFAIKRCLGESVQVDADIFADGHDVIASRLQYRHVRATTWQEAPLRPIGNDRWTGQFEVAELGEYFYTVIAWIDEFGSWRREFERRDDAQDVAIALLVGKALVLAAANRASGADAAYLKATAAMLDTDAPLPERRGMALSSDLAHVVARHADRKFATVYERQLRVTVDPVLARTGAWYEMFPRSCGAGEQHGTFADCRDRLDYIASMGFNIVYLPPIHPIGETKRKGRNNTLTAAPHEPGSPWAIGGAAGGHKDIHPDLGSREDFRNFLAYARKLGLDVALDIAFQCSPDHPYVRQHPEWFRHRPDGSIQYAENPPKNYQDIYPFNFECDEWQALWNELKSVIDFWIDQGVRIFRVDNPHTKPFPFWDWVISETKRQHPETIFLSEAFARPRIMHRLAKGGFTQSYNYFPWRNTKQELTEYFTELTKSSSREYFRPNLWPNTPDILPEYLQIGGRPAFMARFVLAATLGASYGIYGPAFELLEGTPREPGTEEYFDSEKYQLRDWRLDDASSLRDLATRVNRIRRENPALHSDWNLAFHPVDNPMLICYSKSTLDHANIVVVVVNLDPVYRQAGWIELPLERFNLDDRRAYQVHDVLSDKRYLWKGERNYVELDPHQVPAHIFVVRRHVRTERDFDYFL